MVTELRAARREPAPRAHLAAGRGRSRRARAALAHFGLFGTPGLLVYGCFVLAPVALSFWYSLTNYNPFNPHTHFVGLDNYRTLLHDQEFLTSLRVTTVLTVILVIVPNAAGLGIALLLNRKGWFYNAWRGVFFVPMVLSSVVVSIVWTRLLADEGAVNQTLGWIGAAPVGWLSDPSLALYSVAAIMAWQMLGFCVVVYLAGLQSVPDELYEAASIDGATAFSRFRHVTWPLLAPALTINTVVLLISAFKAYDHIQVITNGGPGSGTTATVAFLTLQTGFIANHQGYASAMAVVMLLIVATASAVVLRLLQRREVDL
ncbi:sugar ABC transporter permease [Streptomyces cocklensis]|uniref:Carbohydrate ABC transporter membrane protein 1 (CUT1 family) n=1 Tax=Actinacidiphila cocklensis TaxID=887465 RepID=A0A9W4E3L5_9ACTN|nr:sugar ABC transporter permease [Actinacidiphila cocklensis]MDD1062658.1 sugar ABC transporter permease [Actinacidiphila cocklensis]CAG6392132.1 Carbohydrate ABC transporter membrane protein 1 (CUT1 family) [Actinacidiphila cocklensis]